MPDYKKKKVRRIGKAPKKIYKKAGIKTAENIEMSPKKISNKSPETNEKNVRVIKGRKLERRNKLKIMAILAAVIIAVCTILHFVLPIGIMENLGNFMATIGSGSYPIEIYGTETLNTVQKGSYYYVLTDTNLCAFSNSGKKIYSYAHGYACPILKTSETRAMVFDQGGEELRIYNLSENTNTLNTKTNILTANIARNGSYAVVTESDKYASVVSVYDLEDKLLYEWYSATDLVNNVLLSPDGERVVVSTVYASGGQLKSKVSVLNFKSADPEFSREYAGKTVYSLENCSDGFAILTANDCDYFDWDEYKHKSYSSEYELSLSRNISSELMLVFNRSSNKNDNHIVIISEDGEKLTEFSFNGHIGDIAFLNDHIYCISDTNVYMMDKKGKLLASAKCEFGAVRIVVTGKQETAIVTNGDISRLNIK